jgi:choline dehydrogenase
MPSASRCIAFPAFTASVCNLNPTSRGTVHDPIGLGFEDAPAIAPQLPQH